MVDDDDFERLNQHSWCAVQRSAGVYARRTDNKAHETVYMHREILALRAGDKREADHKNGDTLDNRRSNLRVASHAENKANSHRLKVGKSGFRGVTVIRNKFRASIKQGGKSCDLGRFETAIAAARAYDKAAKSRFGEFARLNFPATK